MTRDPWCTCSDPTRVPAATGTVSMVATRAVTETLRPGQAGTVTAWDTVTGVDAPHDAESCPTMRPVWKIGTAVRSDSAAFINASPASTAAVSGPLGPDWPSTA